MIGDININIRPEKIDTNAQDYLNVCSFHGLLPAHTLPTHQSGSCLDHIMLKSNLSSSALVTNSTITDHSAALLALNCKLPKVNNTRTIAKLNLNKLEVDLRHIDLDPVFNSADPHFCMSYLVENIQQAIHKNTSNIKLSKKLYNLKPWITPGLIRCMKNEKNCICPLNGILSVQYCN